MIYFFGKTEFKLMKKKKQKQTSDEFRRGKNILPPSFQNQTQFQYLSVKSAPQTLQWLCCEMFAP